MFGVIRTIVSFDFFPVYDYINPGFTPTEPYSPQFSWFGFDSINFVEGLGLVITLLILLLFFQAAVSTIIYFSTYRMREFFETQPLFSSVRNAIRKDSWLRNKFDPVIVK